MAKFHLSASGPMICKADYRECPIGGTHYDDYTSASKAFENAMEAEYGAFADVERERFPITEETVGQVITDPAHIKWIAENANEFQGGWATPYLDPEHSVHFKRVDDYYTEVAVLDSDSVPVVSTSFDFTADRNAVVERLAFVARTSDANYGVPATADQIAHAEKLYEAFKANGGDNTQDVQLISAVSHHAATTGDAASYFDRYAATDNSERLRKSGRKSYSPPQEARDFALAVVASAIRD